MQILKQIYIGCLHDLPQSYSTEFFNNPTPYTYMYYWQDPGIEKYRKGIMEMFI